MGLLLNVDRVRLSHAAAVARGMGLATSREDVPLSYCDAVTFDESEAEELAFQTNAARQMARVVNRRGRFGG